MTNATSNATFQLKKIIKDIRGYNKDYYYSNAFNSYVSNLNQYAQQLGLTKFHFENFHYSSTGKTINETGHNSLMNHIETLEEMLPDIQENRSKNTHKTSSGNYATDNKKVFVVHGRDKGALNEVEGILFRAGLEPIVLNRQANSGMTLIEKFESYSNVQYAIVLLTPDDVGAVYEKDSNPFLQFRARQNVLFELGFFYGKLGRTHVCCLQKQSVEQPTDIHGIAYIPFNTSIEEIEHQLLKELKNAKLNVRF